MSQEATTAPALSGDLDAVAKHAAALAVSDAEELMEAVMREAVRMLRDELRGEIKEVVECMKKLECSHEENKQEVALQKGQLAASRQQSEDKFADYEARLAACITGMEELKKDHSNGGQQMDKEGPTPSDLKLMKDKVSTMGNELHSLHAKLSQQQIAQWKNANKEQVEKQISDLHALLKQTKAEIAHHAPKEHVDKQIADLQTNLAQVRDDSTGDQLVEMKAQMQELRTELSGRSLQPDSLTRSDLEAIRETTMAALQAQEAASKEHVDKHITQLRTDLSQVKDEQQSGLAELRVATTKDDTNKQISELYEHLSKIKSESGNENLSEIKGQVQAMQVQLSELKVVSDLEDMKSQMQQMQQNLSEHKGQSELEAPSDVEAIKQVDQKISDLQAHLSKIKDEHESTASDLRGHSEATKENMNKQISDLHSHVSEIKEHLAQRTDKSDVVTRAELDAIRDHLVGETSQLQGHLQEVRKSSDLIPPQVQKELNALNGHVADIRKQSGQSSTETEMQEVQRNMNMHLHELREVVDKLVKGSSREEWVAKVVTLEHDVDELRSEANSLRMAVNSEQERATQAQRKAEEEGVFCKFFM